MKIIWIIICVWIVLMFTLSQIVYAKDDKLPRIQLTYLLNSNHYTSSKPYNENHNGPGIEVRLNDNISLGYMDYTNSFYEPSVAKYLTLDTKITGNWRFGGSLGRVTGYEEHSVTFGAFHIEHKYIRLLVIPSTLYALQFKVPLI